MKIPINSIVIPGRFVTVCNNWHSGLNCMLYAVASTGNLTMGNRRPSGCETDEQWYLSIWQELSCDIVHILYHNAMGDDQEILQEFYDWVETTCAELSTDYGLDDWEN